MSAPKLKRPRMNISNASASTDTVFTIGDFVTTNPSGTYTSDGGLVYKVEGNNIRLLEAFGNRPSTKQITNVWKANSEAEEKYHNIFKPFAEAFHNAFPKQDGGKHKTRRAPRAKRTRHVSKKYM